MKHKSIVLLLVSFVFTTAFISSSKEYNLSSIKGKMSVTFPAVYENTSEGMTEKYTANVGDQIFFAAYTLHEVELAERATLAEVSLNAFNEGVGGSILKKTDWNIKKNKGIQAVIGLELQDAKIQYHVILVGNIQYQLVVIAPNNSWDQVSADKFVKSFKVKK